MRDSLGTCCWMAAGVFAGTCLAIISFRANNSDARFEELNTRMISLQRAEIDKRWDAERYEARMKQVEANAEIARAALVQEKARTEAFEKLLGLMLQGPAPQPFQIPVPPPQDLIPKQNLPTKPID